MSDFKYIDRIIKKSLDQYKSPVQNSAQDFLSNVKDIDIVHSTGLKTSLMSNALKVIISAVIVAGIVISAFFFTPKKTSSETLLPTPASTEQYIVRQTSDTIIPIKFQNSDNNNIQHNNNSNQNNTTPAVIIEIETTEIDTILN